METFNFDLEEFRNNGVYRSAPVVITGRILQSNFMNLELLKDYAGEICRYLKYNLQPITTIYILKWVIDYDRVFKKELPEDYKTLLNWMINNHTKDELTRENPIYDEDDKGYIGMERTPSHAFQMMT